MARRRRVPARLRGLRALFRVLGWLWPGLGATIAYRIWFRVFKVPAPARERPWKAAAKVGFVDFNEHRLLTYRWGEQGPLVVLMHGWGGRGSQLGAFAQPLLDAGFRVLAFDGPGHGESTGDRTSLPELSEALRSVLAEEEKPAFISHSFGTLVVENAIAQGLEARCVVSIGAPTSVDFLVEKFVAGLGINPAIRQRFESRFEADFGQDLWQRFSVDALVPGSAVPALIVHDECDNDVELEQGRILHQAWSGSHALWTRGLGHWRILRDQGVIQSSIDFIRKHDA